MEKIFPIIAYYPEACITIVTAVIAAIITVLIHKISSEQKKKENQTDRGDQDKNGIFYLFFLILCMLLICVVILWTAYNYNTSEPTEMTPARPSTEYPYTVPAKEELKESVETIPKTICELKKSDFALVTASSIYNGDRATHIPTNLIDGKKETNWTEGVNGNGIGEYVQFEFLQEQIITGFRICSGNHSSDSYYEKNARPSEIKLTFEDGSSEIFKVLDIKEELTFQLSEPVTAKTVRLTIQSVYEGSSWEDTVISEIVFLAAK